jgi:hypothetical protein
MIAGQEAVAVPVIDVPLSERLMQKPAAVIEKLQMMRRVCATSVQHIRFPIQTRQVARIFVATTLAPNSDAAEVKREE